MVKKQYQINGAINFQGSAKGAFMKMSLGNPELDLDEWRLLFVILSEKNNNKLFHFSFEKLI